MWFHHWECDCCLILVVVAGVLGVKRVNGIPTVFPAECVEPEENLLKVVYDCGPVPEWQWDDFDCLRQRVASEWTALPKTADVISEPLKKKIQQTRLSQRELNKNSYQLD